MNDDSRIAFEGPELADCPQHAQTLGMALHELATNSIKHGALTDSAGRLRVIWQASEGEHWRIEWRGTLSKPMSPPDRRGFGHVVMVDMVERAVNGKVRLEFGRDGLVWSVEV